MPQDVSYGFRTMARNPGVTAVAVLTLALGIGANTAMFSVINAVLLRPLPYQDPDRLAEIRVTIPALKITGAFASYDTYAEWWRAQSHSFEAMSAYMPQSLSLTSNGEAERVEVLRVNASFLSLLGIRPVMGRDFTPQEDQPGAPHVAILTHALWQRRFGADRGIIGRTLVLDQQPYTVVGIMPPGFESDRGLGRGLGILAPIAQSSAGGPGVPSVGAFARLRRGVRLEQAQAEIDTINRRYAREHRVPKTWGAHVWRMHDYLVRDVRASIQLLTFAVGLVLLIACVNVANLLLARAGARQREIAIRAALGAGRLRIVWQLLTEAALIGCAGGGAGLLLAWAGVRALPLAAPEKFPLLDTVGIDASVLLFTLAATAVTVILFGLAPAFAAVSTHLVESLKEGGRGAADSLRRSRFRALLVVAEVALAVLLVIGATLTTRSLLRLQNVDPGFRPEGVLTASVALPQSGYAEPGRRITFFDGLMNRLKSMPGIKGASMVSLLPFSGSNQGVGLLIEGAPPPAPGEVPILFKRTIDPDYFQAMQIPLLRGRFFNAQDRTGGRPVAIVNDTMARRYWPGKDAVGRRFGNGRDWITVVGVTGDIRHMALSQEPDPEFFLPYYQEPAAAMRLVVRGGQDPMRLVPAVRAAVIGN